MGTHWYKGEIVGLATGMDGFLLCARHFWEPGTVRGKAWHSWLLSFPDFWFFYIEAVDHGAFFFFLSSRSMQIEPWKFYTTHNPGQHFVVDIHV